MRVAMVLENPLFFGGAETHAYELSRQLVMLGHEVDFIQMYGLPKKRTIHKNEKMNPSYWVPAPKSRYLNALHARLLWLYGYLDIPFTSREIRKGKYDIIHLHGFGYSCTLIAAYLAKSNSSKIVCTLHNDTARHIDRKIIKQLAPSVDAFIGVSKAITIKWLDAYGRESYLIPNGVESERFTPEVDGSKIRRKLGLENKFIVLSISRLSYQKGLKYLIRSATILKEKNLDFVILICGTGEDEEYLKKLTKNLHLDNYVRFLKYVPFAQLPELYAACDVFVIASIFEVFSLTMLEAVSSGKQIITTNVGIAKESAKELKDVCDVKIVKSRSSDEIGNAILEIYYKRKVGELFEKAMICHEYAAKKYSWQNIAQQTEKVYLSKLGRANNTY